MLIIVLAIAMAWLFGVACGSFAMHYFAQQQLPLGLTTSKTTSMTVLLTDKETSTEAMTTFVPTVTSTDDTAKLIPLQLWVTDSGERYHVNRDCHGLRKARRVKGIDKCKVCG